MKRITYSIALLALFGLTIGCANEDTTPKTATPEAGEVDDHGHDHAAVDHAAKHGGHLIEMGHGHAYHAELVDNHETESVTVYMMDADMAPLTVGQASISLVLTADGATESFELMASQPGGSAEFSSNDEKMTAMLDKEGATGKLRANIDGKPISGSFTHSGHDHEEDEDHSHN
ncbi:MAG: hypothetical protein ACI814_003793 [Mariniblastus sp.]|jgi:hypothetical protein